jgi:hypothetical protein
MSLLKWVQEMVKVDVVVIVVEVSFGDYCKVWGLPTTPLSFLLLITKN